MAPYEYKIGTTLVGLATLESLGVKAPENEFLMEVDSVTLGNGAEKAVGAPMCQWHWGFLTSAQRATLRTYCTGKSAAVFIRTIKDDNTYANYECVMVWPRSEDRRNGRVIDFTLVFRQLVVAA